MTKAKSIKFITILSAVLLLPAVIGIPTDPNLSNKNKITKEDRKIADYGISNKTPYTVPPLPNKDDKNTIKIKTFRETKLTQKQKKLLKAGNFNAYVKYKAYQSHPVDLSTLTAKEILTLLIAPKLKEKLEQSKKFN